MPRTTLQIDLSTLGLSVGAHEITAIARAPGYAPSVPSEAVTYNVYAITHSLARAAGDNPEVIGDDASVTAQAEGLATSPISNVTEDIQ